MAGVVDQDTPHRGTTSILNWYDCTRPMFIDLVGDYAGKELFLIEGDSLLRECFEDERIDFDGELPFSPVAPRLYNVTSLQLLCWGGMLYVVEDQHHQFDKASYREFLPIPWYLRDCLAMIGRTIY
jgi:hypothetical protein